MELIPNDDFIDAFESQITNYFEQEFISTRSKLSSDLDGASDEYKKKNYRSRSRRWWTQFNRLVTRLLETEILTYQIPTKEFERAVGIFSVINMNGVALDTFDLLVAKSSDSQFALRWKIIDKFKSLQKELNERTLHSQSNVNERFDIFNFLSLKIQAMETMNPHKRCLKCFVKS